MQALGYDQEKELFDVLGPQLSARTLEVADRYGIGREALEQTRPWFAYFVLNSAYRTSLSEASDHQQIEMPDAVLAQLAQRAGKMIRSEFETDDDVLRYFAEMSETEQRERLEMLLDYLDDDQAGNLDDRLDWISGTLPRDADRFIDRMRRKTPALYRVEHVRRNKQWAERIVTLLSQGGVYFVVIGLNHILGPDSLLKALDEIGITPSAVRHV